MAKLILVVNPAPQFQHLTRFGNDIA